MSVGFWKSSFNTAITAAFLRKHKLKLLLRQGEIIYSCGFTHFIIKYIPQNSLFYVCTHIFSLALPDLWENHEQHA